MNKCPKCGSDDIITYKYGFPPGSVCNKCFTYFTLWQQAALESAQKRIAELEKYISRHTTIELCHDNDFNPFAREELKILDYGVADKIYVVESELFNSVKKENSDLREMLKEALVFINAFQDDDIPDQEKLVVLVRKLEEI
jgi:hypothetical protein